MGEILEKTHPNLLEIHDHVDGDKDGHDHGPHDPHIWLGPERAKVMVDIIADQLAELEPSKKENFLKRARDYKGKLDELKKYGEAKFKGKTNLKIVTQHESLGHFAAEFNLKIVGHIRMQSGIDEGTKVELIRTCREKRPAVFTYEPQYNIDEVQSLRNTLKREGINTEIAEVDPIEQDTTSNAGSTPSPDYYMERMRKNIDNLAQALK